MNDYVIPSNKDLSFVIKFTAINYMIMNIVHTKNESSNLKITAAIRFFVFYRGVNGRGWILILQMSAYTHRLYCLQIL